MEQLDASLADSSENDFAAVRTRRDGGGHRFWSCYRDSNRPGVKKRADLALKSAFLGVFKMKLKRNFGGKMGAFFQ